MLYRVSYEIDVEANTHLEAAEGAYEAMRDPSSMYPVLDVVEIDEDGERVDEPVRFDLSEVGKFAYQ